LLRETMGVILSERRISSALRFGGQVPWEDEPGQARACCLDHNNPVVFEIRRIKPDE